MKPETLAIRATHYTDQNARAVTPPISLSTTFERDPDGTLSGGFIYTRTDNPNRQQLEYALAALEGGQHGFAFASGIAAITAVAQLLHAGDHIVAEDGMYNVAKFLLEEIFGPFQIQVTYVDMSDLAAVKAAIQPDTRLIWMESPTNPLLKITDIRAVTALAKQRSILTGLDNTWATPVLQQPLSLGVDIVQHSTTKYLGGHSDVLGGALIVNDDALATRLRRIQTLTGAVPSPFDCWLVSRGIKTLPLRMREHCANAQKIAEFLTTHPQVHSVHYPGLPTHPGYATNQTQMRLPGGMLSFQVYGGHAGAASVLSKVQLFTRATSLGGAESLIEHRRPVEGANSITPEDLLRVSVGLEHTDDLIADLAQALSFS
jgi:cystathionine gamma-synthase